MTKSNWNEGFSSKPERSNLSYQLFDVFASDRFGGNQLAVFNDAALLSPAEMQQIAAELNLSETAFVQSAGPEFRVRFFTPTKELPFAGHPTLGAAAFLEILRGAPLGEMANLTLREGIETLADFKVTVVRGSERRARATVKLTTEPLTLCDKPKFDPAVISLSPQDIGNYLLPSPCVVSAGVPFTIIPLKNREALGRARLNLQIWHDTLKKSAGPHLYLYAPADRGSNKDVDFYVRMFAPQLGITEDPATGAGAAAFAGILSESQNLGTFVLKQGVEMGRPSLLTLNIADQIFDGYQVELSGDVIHIGQGEIFRG